jgi:hypothetical protein
MLANGGKLKRARPGGRSAEESSSRKNRPTLRQDGAVALQDKGVEAARAPVLDAASSPGPSPREPVGGCRGGEGCENQLASKVRESWTPPVGDPFDPDLEIADDSRWTD